ncbi:hypothetical protein BGZ61DRAFT_373977 [Ilyonectria robusta]|uniref:uncharacterized protein n=1 Tax=Ilyonectria robusta TaxID=1079257 RepID=UPI001E8D7679|nr:uncharacterized protein BGZ61DRAFT_373977 [Ilyonectria robusta]KAH6957532.1 hypothetical protein BKA56DRAFT_663000 [Ilyonectria sp. MPI-CAGE-AT-0026]KAH8654179.1 hypothetical protein BGZ61DRAFT_373977 [Ilyonectria robusta]
MSTNFRPHVAHRHDFLPNDKVRLETPLDGMPYKLTMATNINKLDFDNIHSTCFKVIGGDIIGIEHGEGPAPLAASKIPNATEVGTDEQLVDALIKAGVLKAT